MFAWLRRYFCKKPQCVDEITQARHLIAAIDRGGVPLNPLKINTIARALGLDVSRNARPEDTLARIRACLARIDR